MAKASIPSMAPRVGIYFDVLLYPGDLITVPTNTLHWFMLTELRKVKAIRIFESKDGWVAVYDESELQKRITYKGKDDQLQQGVSVFSFLNMLKTLFCSKMLKPYKPAFSCDPPCGSGRRTLSFGRDGSACENTYFAGLNSYVCPPFFATSLQFNRVRPSEPCGQICAERHPAALGR